MTYKKKLTFLNFLAGFGIVLVLFLVVKPVVADAKEVVESGFFK